MDRIRQLRMERGLSQAKLAVTAGMDPATLNRLEQGKGNPNLKTLERVADALGVEVVDLFPKVSAQLEPTLLNGLEDERLSSPDTITIGWRELREMLRRVYNQEREPDAAIEELRGT
jgi:transcriptional regulator with XRE-family HTH domain